MTLRLVKDSSGEPQRDKASAPPDGALDVETDGSEASSPDEALLLWFEERIRAMNEAADRLERLARRLRDARG